MSPREEAQLLASALLAGVIFVAFGGVLFALWGALPDIVMYLAIPALLAFLALGWSPIFNAIAGFLERRWPRS